jgi:hypothetical protein
MLCTAHQCMFDPHFSVSCPIISLSFIMSRFLNHEECIIASASSHSCISIISISIAPSKIFHPKLDCSLPENLFFDESSQTNRFSDVTRIVSSSSFDLPFCTSLCDCTYSKFLHCSILYFVLLTYCLFHSRHLVEMEDN